MKKKNKKENKKVKEMKNHKKPQNIKNNNKQSQNMNDNSQKKKQNNNTNSYYEIVDDVYNQCSKLGGSGFIRCADQHMEQKGLDKKTRQYIIWDELLGLD